MENEKLFSIAHTFRVLVRDESENTYIAIESNGQNIMIDADNWNRFKSFFSLIDKEFSARCLNKVNQESLFPVSHDCKVLINGFKEDVNVIIESGESSIKLKPENWINLVEIFSDINTDFKRRTQSHGSS